MLKVRTFLLILAIGILLKATPLNGTLAQSVFNQLELSTMSESDTIDLNVRTVGHNESPNSSKRKTKPTNAKQDSDKTKSAVKLVVLGIAQDAGFPQAACRKACCRAAWKDARLRRMVSCVAVVDEKTGQRWLFDCTPDFPEQLRLLDEKYPVKDNPGIAGIFLTHAHIGHYTGLMFLGRETMGTQNVPVYTMPRMGEFLKSNGPWSQLVKLKNIALNGIAAQETVKLNERVRVTPFRVPHRDEFSETVGFKIEGPNKSVVYLPDIDKWARWEKSVEELIKTTDIALLDGTFLADGEIPGRDMKLIPHPFINESIKRFAALDESQRNKVKFIHLNHTNPAINPNGEARQQIRRAGMSVAKQGESIEL